MNFILDAHIPLSLCKIFIEKGHSVIHTNGLSADCYIPHAAQLY